MWGYFDWLGVREKSLSRCLMTLVLPTSSASTIHDKRAFLDHRLKLPVPCLRRDGRHRYADVEAVRVCAEGAAGPRVLLRETWERYHLPISVTEAHLGCSREEQVRWVKEVWDAAESLRRDEVDIRAVTAWSLLGAYDWNTLLTRSEGHYEPGVFDLRAPRPRATAMARMLRDLAAGREHDHPLLHDPGWWRRLDRLLYPSVRVQTRARETAARRVSTRSNAARPRLITGARGTLGSAFARLCQARGISYRLLTRAEMDIADPVSVETALTEFEPWAIVNAAGYVRVDDAEREPHVCLRENTDGPAILAAACARRQIALLTFSSDSFSTARLNLHRGSDRVAPLASTGRARRKWKRAS